jgi:hypothetical protein
MPTNLELISERQRLASEIAAILEGNVIDESTGEVSINTEDFHKLEELWLSLDDNRENSIYKTEAMVFAMKMQQSKVDAYDDVIKHYQSLKKKAVSSIEWLNSQIHSNIERLGEDNRLPTPSFPKLRLQSSGKNKVTINENYSGEIDDDLFKSRTVTDISKTAAKEKYGDNPPLDENGEPLYYVTRSEPSVRTK